MDLQSFVDNFYEPTCVVSVEKTDDGYGEIRLVAGNKKYTDMIEMRLKGEYLRITDDTDTSFIPDSLYYRYLPQNRSFEDVCYRAAVQKTPIHTYAHMNNLDIWFDITVTPLELNDGNKYYCTYTAIASNNADIILDTDHTTKTANDVLKTCIKLHRADNLKDAMEGVIAETRQICKGECCTVLLINEKEETYSILATDFRENSNLKRVTEFENYYDIAASWPSMIGEENDCIIVQNDDDMDYIRRENNAWYQTLVEAGVKSLVLFPLRQGEELLGFIWVTNFNTDDTLRIKETLELTTFFISSHIARYKVLKHLKHMSYTDTLTGLPNRFDCLEHIADLVGKGEKFTVVSVNINNFKSINDAFGFDTGNKVLVKIAGRWKALSDSSGKDIPDYITRINGDEFIIIIRGYSSEKELRQAISIYVDSLTEHFSVDDCDLYVTAGFGYAEYPTDADTTDSLISHANAAMNEIKRARSSDHILRFSTEILSNEPTLEIENKIRNALENDTIYFNLQPQYDMDHKLRGFEALARMRDSDGTFISPGEFIPVAEKVGLIDKVDSMVFRKSTDFFSRMLRKTGADLTLSLNASVRHLLKNNFVDEIRKLLSKSGIAPQQLEIEITESILIDSADKALQCINELKNMGIKLAIDDFGTGYSSLSYLNRFPADLLKIDKSFIDKINANESSKQYVAAMISIGHIMGLDVISEGVETDEQIDALRSIGCDFIQGFVWGRPLSEEDAEKLIDSIC